MPGSIPIGGGVDGPLYADYQDVTDQHQVAGAANAVREKLNLLSDSLVLDINKFSGDLKLYFAKANAPILPPMIKLRTSGPLETTLSTLEDVQKEFMRLIEMLPPKLRVALLKNMMLPKDKRDPELNGLEKTLQDHAKATLWARAIVARFRRGSGEDEEDKEERHGIYSAEEEEELLPPGTEIPETKYVPIGRLDPYEMTQDQITKQIQANTVFVLETQLGILKIHLASLDDDDPAKALLKEFPRVIAKMIRQSKTFVNVCNLLDHEKAQKVSIGLEKIDFSIVQEQRLLLDKAQRYAIDGPSTAVVSFATAMLGIAVIGCQLLRSKCSLSALFTEGTSLLLGFLLTYSPVAGEALIGLKDNLGKGFQAIGVPNGPLQILQILLLVAAPSLLMVSLEDTIPVLAAYNSNTAKDIHEALESTIPDDDEKHSGEEEFNRMARESAVRLAAWTNTISELSYPAAKTIFKNISKENKSFDLEATCVQLTMQLAGLLTGSQLFERAGDQAKALFASMTTPFLQDRMEKFQELIDKGLVKPSVAELLNSLRLSELTFEGTNFFEHLAAREQALEALGIRLNELRQAGEDLVQLAAFFALSQNLIGAQRRVVAPSVNVFA